MLTELFTYTIQKYLVYYSECHIFIFK